MSIHKLQYLQEASTKLQQLNILLNDYHTERFMKLWMRLNKKEVETISDCIRYQKQWIVGYLKDCIAPGRAAWHNGQSIEAYRWLINRCECNPTFMETQQPYN
jgi:hypothetical protein